MLKKILYTVEGPGHATLEEFVNESLPLRLGLPSTLVPHENGGFQNRSSNLKNLKMSALHFPVDGKRFSKATWRNNQNANPKWPAVIAPFLKFLPRSVVGLGLNSLHPCSYLIFFPLCPRFGKDSKAVAYLLEKTTENLNTPEHLKEVKIHGTLFANQCCVVPYAKIKFKEDAIQGLNLGSSKAWILARIVVQNEVGPSCCGHGYF